MNATMMRFVTNNHNTRRYFTSRYRTNFMTSSLISSLPTHNYLKTEQYDASKEKQYKRLDVAIVGPPNAGKSQLLNQLISKQLAAVSRKRHTTRDSILGVKKHTIPSSSNSIQNSTDTEIQLIFMDTPGYIRIENAKQERIFSDLIESINLHSQAMDNVDYTLLVIDAARKIDFQMKEILYTLMKRAIGAQGRFVAGEEVSDDNDDYDYDDESFTSSELENDSSISLNIKIFDEDGKVQNTTENISLNGKRKKASTSSHKHTSKNGEKFAIILNKVDLVHPKEQLLDLADMLSELGDACIAEYQNGISRALKNDGVHDILNHLYQLATPESSSSAILLHGDDLTTMSTAERVEEVIREKLYRCLHKELPHSIQQSNRMFKSFKRADDESKRILRIDQDLIVQTKSHHRLVNGRGGSTLERIRSSALNDLKKIFREEGYDDIILTLHVKLNKSNNRARQNSTRSVDLVAERHGVVAWKLH